MKKLLSFLRCISALLLGSLLTFQHNGVAAQSEVQDLQKKLQEAQKNEKKLKALCKAQQEAIQKIKTELAEAQKTSKECEKNKNSFPYEDDFIKNLWTNRINYNGHDLTGRGSNKCYIDHIKKCLKGLKDAISQMQSEDEINEAKRIAKALAELPNIKDFTLNPKYNDLQETLQNFKNKAPQSYKAHIFYEKINYWFYPSYWVKEK